MPSYKTHFFVALLGWGIALILVKRMNSFSGFSPYFDVSVDLLFVATLLAILGSVLPDLDAQQSKVNQYIELLLGCSILALIFLKQIGKLPDYTTTLGLAFVGLIIVFINLLKHRGIMHSFWITLIPAAFLWLIAPIFSIAFVIGFGSHLIADNV